MLGPGPQLGASWALGGKKGFSSQRVEKEGTGRTSHSVRGRDSSCRWGPKSYSLVCAKVLPSPSRGVHQKRPGATAPRQEAKGAWILGRGLRGGAPFGRVEAGASRLWWQLERRLGLSRGCWMRVSGELLGKQRPSTWSAFERRPPAPSNPSASEEPGPLPPTPPHSDQPPQLLSRVPGSRPQPLPHQRLPDFPPHSHPLHRLLQPSPLLFWPPHSTPTQHCKSPCNPQPHPTSSSLSNPVDNPSLPSPTPLFLNPKDPSPRPPTQPGAKAPLFSALPQFTFPCADLLHCEQSSPALPQQACPTKYNKAARKRKYIIL